MYQIRMTRDGGKTWPVWGEEESKDNAQSQVWDLEDELGVGNAFIADEAGNRLD